MTRRKAICCEELEQSEPVVARQVRPDNDSLDVQWVGRQMVPIKTTIVVPATRFVKAIENDEVATRHLLSFDDDRKDPIESGLLGHFTNSQITRL
jgi:hypothetical protein